MSRSTYYKCDGCTHATFNLPEAIQHFAEMGPRHTTTNARLRFNSREWRQMFESYESLLFVEDDGDDDVDDQIVEWR